MYGLQRTRSEGMCDVGIVLLTDIVSMQVFSDEFVERGIAIVDHYEVIWVLLGEYWIEEVLKSKGSNSLR